MGYQELIKQIEDCNFECVGGSLEKHIAWIALKKKITNLEPESDDEPSSERF